MAYKITKEMKEEDKRFLKNLPETRMDQGALLMRNQGDGPLVLGGLDMYEEKRGRLIILFI